MGNDGSDTSIVLIPDKFYCVGFATFDDPEHLGGCQQTYRGTYGGCTDGADILAHGAGDNACFDTNGWFGVGMDAYAIIVDCVGPFDTFGECNEACKWHI